MDWDDLRYVLAIHRGGNMAAAARLLGVATPSVYRRLETIEHRLEARLFDRLRSGYKLTTAGEALAAAAERVEREVHAAERSVRGKDARLQGHLRVSTSDALAFLMLPLLKPFRELHPGITLEISTTYALVDLARRDADVVVRSGETPPEHLVGKSVGRVAFASYASRDYLDARGRDQPLPKYEWIGYQGSLAKTGQALWMERNVPDERIRIRFDQFELVRRSAVAGLGCAPMPCFLGDRDDALERLPQSRQETDVKIWVLTHPDLRRTARVRAFLQFFGKELSGLVA